MLGQVGVGVEGYPVEVPKVGVVERTVVEELAVDDLVADLMGILSQMYISSGDMLVEAVEA